MTSDLLNLFIWATVAILGTIAIMGLVAYAYFRHMFAEARKI